MFSVKTHTFHMVQRYIMDVRYINCIITLSVKNQTRNLLPPISELMSNRWKRIVLQTAKRKTTSKSIWLVSREEVVYPHCSGQPFKGPGASLCPGSSGQASAAQGVPEPSILPGSSRMGKLGACLAPQQPYWGAHGNHLCSNIYLERGYGL